MATFQVPQFIEEQPRVVGFLTLPQFLYLAAAAGISLGAFYLFTFMLWIFVTLVVATIGIALAFVKVNGQAMPAVLRSAFSFYWKPRIYTWSRLPTAGAIGKLDADALVELRSKMSIEEKLRSLAFQITTGKIFSRAADQHENAERFQTVTYLTGEKRVARRIDYTE